MSAEIYPAEAPTSSATAQVDRPRGDGVAGRARNEEEAPVSNHSTVMARVLTVAKTLQPIKRRCAWPVVSVSLSMFLGRCVSASLTSGVRGG